MTGTGSPIDDEAASQRGLRPTSIAEALVAAAGPHASLFAGGCEFGLQNRIAHGDIISLDQIPGLDRLVAHPKIGLTIGASVRMHAIVNQIWIAKRWAALHEAVEQLLPPQIRNMATVVGNVCAARPDYDMACALMALRGSLRAVKTDGETVSVALDTFYDHAGRIALAPGFIVREIFVPPPSPDAGSAFRKAKFGATTVSAAASVSLDAGGERIEQATLVIGGCSPAPRHAHEAESLLRGAPAISGTYKAAGEASTQLLAGVHAPRIKLISVLARDALEQAASRARSKHNPFDDAQHLL